MQVTEIPTTKLGRWSYEDEYRVFPQLNEPDPSGLYFNQFDARIALHAVIVRHHANVTRAQVGERRTADVSGSACNPASSLRLPSCHLIRRSGDAGKINRLCEGPVLQRVVKGHWFRFGLCKYA